MFMSDVSIIVRRLRTKAERNQASLGIGFPEQLVLMHLKSNGSSNQENIATKLEIDKGAIAKTVSKLEQKGLVSRTVNPANKREKFVELTGQAETVLASMRDSYLELEQAMYKGLTGEQVEQMTSLVAVVAANLSNIDEE